MFVVSELLYYIVYYRMDSMGSTGNGRGPPNNSRSMMSMLDGDYVDANVAANERDVSLLN